MTTRKRTVKYAFWPYDLFPYVLSAKAVGSKRDGTIEVEGYGKGARVKPLVVLSGKKGEGLHADLKSLRTNYRIAKADVTRDYHTRLLALAPFMKRARHVSFEVEES